MMRKILTITVFSVLLVHSCVVKYAPVEVNSKDFEMTDSTSSVSILFSNHHFLSENKRYYRRAQKNSIQIYKVQVTNSTDSVLELTPDNLQVFLNFQQIDFFSVKKTFRKSRQTAWEHWFTLGLGAISGVGTGGGKGLTYNPNFQNPLYYVIPAFGIFNTVRVVINNQKYKKQLLQYDLFYKEFPPHSVTYGTVFLKADSLYKPLIRISRK